MLGKLLVVLLLLACVIDSTDAWRRRRRRRRRRSYHHVTHVVHVHHVYHHYHHSGHSSHSHHVIHHSVHHITVHHIVHHRGHVTHHYTHHVIHHGHYRHHITHRHHSRRHSSHSHHSRMHKHHSRMARHHHRRHVHHKRMARHHHRRHKHHKRMAKHHKRRRNHHRRLAKHHKKRAKHHRRKSRHHARMARHHARHGRHHLARHHRRLAHHHGRHARHHHRKANHHRRRARHHHRKMKHHRRRARHHKKRRNHHRRMARHHKNRRNHHRRHARHHRRHISKHFPGHYRRQAKRRAAHILRKLRKKLNRKVRRALRRTARKHHRHHKRFRTVKRRALSRIHQLLSKAHHARRRDLARKQRSRHVHRIHHHHHHFMARKWIRIVHLSGFEAMSAFKRHCGSIRCRRQLARVLQHRHRKCRRFLSLGDHRTRLVAVRRCYRVESTIHAIQTRRCRHMSRRALFKCGRSRGCRMRMLRRARRCGRKIALHKKHHFLIYRGSCHHKVAHARRLMRRAKQVAGRYSLANHKTRQRYRRLARARRHFNAVVHACRHSSRPRPSCHRAHHRVKRMEIKRASVVVRAGRCSDESVRCVKRLMHHALRMGRRIRHLAGRCRIHLPHHVRHELRHVEPTPVYSITWRHAVGCTTQRRHFARWVRYQNLQRNIFHAEACKCKPLDSSCLRYKMTLIIHTQQRIAQGRSDFTHQQNVCDACAPIKLEYRRWLRRMRNRRAHLHRSLCRCKPGNVHCHHRRLSRILRLQKKIRERRHKALSMHTSCTRVKTAVSAPAVTTVAEGFPTSAAVLVTDAEGLKHTLAPKSVRGGPKHPSGILPRADVPLARSAKFIAPRPRSGSASTMTISAVLMALVALAAVAI